MTDADVADRRVDRWLTDSEADEQAAAYVLASMLIASPQSLSKAVEETRGWDRGAALGAVERLLARPFVERRQDGLQISDSVAARLRSRLKQSDPWAYRAIAETLLEEESALLGERDEPDEQWYSRARIAYYLAALDPARSAASFIDAFAHPPAGDAGPPRSWLSELVLRQREDLASQARALAFFEGWQAYKSGLRGRARDSFLLVLDGQEQDEYRAIALHLWVTLGAAESEQAEALLRQSVDLSRSLHLTENEVMGTNTLVFNLIGDARRTGDLALLGEATRYAEQNLRLARESGDRHLATWCLSAAATARWLNESRLGEFGKEVDDSRAKWVIRALDAAKREAYWRGDLEGMADALNAEAQVHRDRGQYGRAIRVLEHGLDDLRADYPPAAARRWTQTARSLRRFELNTAEHKRLDRLTRKLDVWLGSLGSDRD